MKRKKKQANTLVEICGTFWKPCLAEGMNNLLKFLSKVTAEGYHVTRHATNTWVCVEIVDGGKLQ